LADEKGAFALTRPAAATQVFVVRIGFRPRRLPLPRGAGRIEIAMDRIPTFLTPAQVSERSRCPRRSDAALALGLWDQARAALLAAVVARETNPPDAIRLGYERVMDSTTTNIRRMSVQRDSVSRLGQSFAAVRSAQGFLIDGFASDAGEATQHFYAPDADVLLDSTFARGYCLRVMPPDERRPTQVGIGFSAPDRRDGRIDVNGALWLDTLAREIREIEYKYVGLDDRVAAFNPGGRVSFRTMPSGAPFVDIWDIRLVGAQFDGATVSYGSKFGERPLRYYRTESGGELAHAVWPDGSRYDAALGSARLRFTGERGIEPQGLHVRLAETPFEATLDATHLFTAVDLVPGPYVPVLVDPRLAAIGYDVPLNRAFRVGRGETHTDTIRVGRLEDEIVRECRRLDGRSNLADSMVVVGRVTDSTGVGIGQAGWDVYVKPTNARVAGGRTSTEGFFMYCPSAEGLLGPVGFKIVITRSGAPDFATDFVPNGRLNVVPIQVAPRRK
jgi:hypothetical protein